MKKLIIITASVIAVVFLVATAYQAWRIRQDINDAFREVNQSIQMQNDLLSNTFISDQKKILETQNDETARTFFLIDSLSKDTEHYLDSLMHNIEVHSSGDGDIVYADSLLTKTPEGYKLYLKLQAYRDAITTLMRPYHMTIQLPLDLTPPRTIEGLADKSIKGWLRAYFEQVPTVAAITLLFKFKNDIQHTVAICANQLAESAVKKK